MTAHFCEKTGVRIVAPGVSKAVDPEKGHDEYSEPLAAAEPEKTSEPVKTELEKDNNPKPAKPGK